MLASGVFISGQILHANADLRTTSAAVELWLEAALAANDHGAACDASARASTVEHPSGELSLLAAKVAGCSQARFG